MKAERTIIRVETPEARPGFLGTGHMARQLVGADFTASDPFIILMDDVLDKTDFQPAGGAHPHAGFETVSLLLEGEIGDEAHKMQRGDFQLMTAGSGVVHTETIDRPMRLRLLQLWLNLPSKNRNATPRVQDLPLEHVPVLNKDGVQIRLYSGSLNGLTAPVLHYVPLIVADITLEAGTTALLDLPATYNAFVYILKGSVSAGADAQVLHTEQVGWLDLQHTAGASILKVTAQEGDARLVLYAGAPQHEKIVAHGPFIADSADAIPDLYHRYRSGRMPHIATVPAAQRILL
ncbi:pirin family protein [Niabella pedocola]|uniref:Pirin family protein n=1 Tax=Niabella pedocola TaxID=1752077 RepID=A0ABS8PX56_9BACT|nr:pirin-like C-terminal cupin domain-containing protein [Niabella pedocola]MCD2424491.1 pirin family protein [Niabella pedocola]